MLFGYRTLSSNYPVGWVKRQQNPIYLFKNNVNRTVFILYLTDNQTVLVSLMQLAKLDRAV